VCQNFSLLWDNSSCHPSIVYWTSIVIYVKIAPWPRATRAEPLAPFAVAATSRSAGSWRSPWLLCWRLARTSSGPFGRRWWGDEGERACAVTMRQLAGSRDSTRGTQNTAHMQAASRCSIEAQKRTAVRIAYDGSHIPSALPALRCVCDQPARKLAAGVGWLHCMRGGRIWIWWPCLLQKYMCRYRCRQEVPLRLSASATPKYNS
jgi:hypothetical protein